MNQTWHYVFPKIKIICLSNKGENIFKFVTGSE